MQPPQKSHTCLLLLVVLLGAIPSRTAPRQATTYVWPLAAWKDLAGGFDFPQQDQDQDQGVPSEIPEPRTLYVNLEAPPEDRQQEELQQVLLLTSGLTPAQLVQRREGVANEGRFLNRGTTVFVFTSPASGGVNNTNTNNIVTNATAVPAATTTTTGTRTSEFIRAPIGYPMQYFRKRQDDGPPSALSYPELFGWDEASLYGGELGHYGGFGVPGLNGIPGIPGVPLVPITIGNEVRYVPMQLRMYRHLAAGGPVPAIREQGDRLEEQEEEEQAPELEVGGHGPDVGHQLGGGGATGYGILGQRLRPRPVVRRRPLQSLAQNIQNIRRVQYLRK
ncbi:uncharacterized protein LOC108046074 [Drosophila rhopaloa]|uniref:Uncharacterized protein n=1 Tax=Drosophila rhopaloa TaxID=1041015 RepID=A0ABM5JEA9_DRORH|nr:uncharacterized protein LOC108046074 [Drosophila rhopaloa]